MTVSKQIGLLALLTLLAACAPQDNTATAGLAAAKRAPDAVKKTDPTASQKTPDASQPFSLDDGNYGVECWAVSVEQPKNGDFARNSFYFSGKQKVTHTEGKIVEELQIDGSTGEQVVETTTTALPDGTFSQLVKSTNTLGDESKPRSSVQTIKVKLLKNVIQFLSIQKGEQAEKPSTAEFTWQKMKDGRIVEQQYLREKDSYTEADGTLMASLVGNTTCVFKPQAL